MSRKVHANGREVVTGGDHGKILGAFPDVCSSSLPHRRGRCPCRTPTAPTHAVKRGSKRVEIGGQGVGLRDISFFESTPLGNEAATEGLGGSPISHRG